MILTQAQAKAVYDAMCALNNVSGQINRIQFGDLSEKAICVGQIDSSESVRVWYVEHFQTRRNENFTTQDDFVTAYGVK